MDIIKANTDAVYIFLEFDCDDRYGNEITRFEDFKKELLFTIMRLTEESKREYQIITTIEGANLFNDLMRNEE